MSGAGVLTLGESMGLIRGGGIGDFAQLGVAEIDTGGAEGNVAVGLARLGVPVTWLGRIGEDSLGRRVVRDLRGEGVDVRAVIDPAAPTGLMLKETPRTGSTSVTYYRRGSAGSRLRPADLDSVDVEAAALLHVTGVTLALSDSARDTVRVAVARARAAGVPVSFDVNHRSRLWDADAAAPVYREIAASADVLFAGGDEAALTLGVAESVGASSLAAGLADLGAGEVILKHGADGASAFVDGELIRAAAVTVDVIDTVGAGDAFVAGYLSELLAGASVRRRLETATLAGAFACRHPGDWHGAARRSDIDAPEGDPVRR